MIPAGNQTSAPAMPGMIERMVITVPEDRSLKTALPQNASRASTL